MPPVAQRRDEHPPPRIQVSQHIPDQPATAESHSPGAEGRASQLVLVCVLGVDVFGLDTRRPGVADLLCDGLPDGGRELV